MKNFTLDFRLQILGCVSVEGLPFHFGTSKLTMTLDTCSFFTHTSYLDLFTSSTKAIIIRRGMFALGKLDCSAGQIVGMESQQELAES